MKTWKDETDFKEEIKKDLAVTKILSGKEIEGCFNLSHFLRHIPRIFRRLGI